MDHTPRAETIRLWAAGAYLPFVAIYLLASRRFREVRLIKFHAWQAIGVAIFLGLMLLLGSIVATLFGPLPGLGLLINLLVGVLFMGALLIAAGIAFYGAIMGYQGNYTGVPILTDWVWTQVNGSGRPVATPRKKRRVRRVATFEEGDWGDPTEAEEEEPT